MLPGMFNPFMGVSSAGTVINDLLGLVNIPGGKLGAAVDMLGGNPLGMLANLHDAYMEAAIGRGTGPIERMMGGAIPPFGYMPPPTSMLPIMQQMAGGGYFGGGIQQLDLAPGHGNDVFSQLFDPQRRDAAHFETFLNKNPYAKAAFEQSVGGQIINDGRNDGVLTIQRFAPGFAPLPGFAQNPLANSALGLMAGMNQSILGQAGSMGLLGAAGGGILGMLTGNPFTGLALGGLGGIASALLGGPMAMLGGNPMAMLGGGNPLAMLGGGGFGGGFGFGGLQSPLGGIGAGSWNPMAMPGRINNTNPAYEQQSQAQIDSVLRDPSLTVEDKVTLMLMLIMNKMDKDIERQEQYINSIQQQQSNQQGKGAKGGGLLGAVGGIAGNMIAPGVGGMIGGALGQGIGGAMGQNGQNAPSIDIETTKLKRMIDKRSQMFDTLRQIIDKYNETAKNMINSIGR